MIAAHRLPLDVPVRPDADEARRWAEDELSDRIYDTSPSLLERILNWFGEFLESIFTLGGLAPPNVAPVIVVLVIAGVILLAVLLGGRLRRRRHAPSARDALTVFEDDRSSRELADSADRASRSGDFVTAVLERFRALIRTLDERGVIDERPGMTAHEATSTASAALPDHAAALMRAGTLFENVYYGDHRPDSADDASLRDLHAQVAAAHVRNAGVS